ncbi:MAG: hypothetical protein WBP72_06170 [Rhodocyclaceae bacterium]
MLMTSAMVAVAGVWELGYRREKEAELLFIGGQFRRALAGFYKDGTNEVDRYPRQLADLVKDPRILTTRRYLRKLYTDPITGTTEWGLLRNANGGIIGVHSASDKEPLKKINFRKADEGFTKKEKYAQWIFVYQPSTTTTANTTGTAATTGTGTQSTTNTGSQSTFTIPTPGK